jgi:hypothetical protein
MGMLQPMRGAACAGLPACQHLARLRLQRRARSATPRLGPLGIKLAGAKSDRH